MIVVQETRTQGRDCNRTSTAPMWLQVKLHWTLKHTKGRGPFLVEGTSSCLVPQLINEFSSWIQYFVVSVLMCKFMTWVGVSQTKGLRPTRGMDTGTQWNPSPCLKGFIYERRGKSKLPELLPSSQATELAQHWITRTNSDITLILGF